MEARHTLVALQSIAVLGLCDVLTDAYKMEHVWFRLLRIDVESAVPCVKFDDGSSSSILRNRSTWYKNTRVRNRSIQKNRSFSNTDFGHLCLFSPGLSSLPFLCISLFFPFTFSFLFVDIVSESSLTWATCSAIKQRMQGSSLLLTILLNSLMPWLTFAFPSLIFLFSSLNLMQWQRILTLWHQEV